MQKNQIKSNYDIKLLLVTIKSSVTIQQIIHITIMIYTHRFLVFENVAF